MTVTDPIANMLTMIRNAITARKETLEVPASKLSEAILDILKEEGYLENYKRIEDKKQGTIKIYLKFDQGKKSAITGLERISRPGLRVYAEKDKIPRVLNGLGLAIISTSKGILTDVEARKQNIGGEVLLYIW
ncbi:MAG: 30S ribosomal protein S8 [Candidatus Omnitrophica bacterium]|nr:30S ribosomal protein S8 [Candidatus Omnitrophota bacterium]